MFIHRLLAAALVLGSISQTSAIAAGPAPQAVPTSRLVTYKTVNVKGLNIFYREAGPANAPAILLQHGFPWTRLPN